MGLTLGLRGRAKAQEWAGKSGGMFPTMGGAFVRWEELQGDAELQDSVRWEDLKQEERAIEKVIRCYGEDVSRLVDVCRQSIVFAEVDQLAACFELIASDPAAELMRVKNRMSLGLDGRESAGFRNVSMNLRIRDEDAKSFGVDTHVCELQLLLLDFAKLQVDALAIHGSSRRLSLSGFWASRR